MKQPVLTAALHYAIVIFQIIEISGRAALRKIFWRGNERSGTFRQLACPQTRWCQRTDPDSKIVALLDNIYDIVRQMQLHFRFGMIGHEFGDMRSDIAMTEGR